MAITFDICVTGPFEPVPKCNGPTLGPWDPNQLTIQNLLRLVVQPPNYLNIYNQQYINQLNQISTVVSPTTYSVQIGDGAIYRPGLLAKDVWKWDLSGESDYGIVEPPINKPNYDLFDSNWSAQFIVYANADTTEKINCSTIGLDSCSHAMGETIRGPTTDPYMFCPAKNMRPDILYGVSGSSGGSGGSRVLVYDPGIGDLVLSSISSGSSGGIVDDLEPTYLEIFNEYNKINECKLIEKVLGKDYLGCNYDDPYSESSCGCPERGNSYGKYLEYTKINSTFWETPESTPMFRHALMSHLGLNQIKIKVDGYRSEAINLGDIIEIKHYNDGIKNNLNSGKWLIVSISHEFISETYYAIHLLLARTAIPKTGLDLGIPIPL